MIASLAAVLGLDSRELFLLANPRAKEMIGPEPESKADSAWDIFRNDEQLRRRYNISDEEMEILERAALLGEVRGTSDFIYILNAIRHAVGR